MSIYGFPNKLPDNLPNQNKGKEFPPADNNGPFTGLYTPLFPGSPNVANCIITAPIDNTNTSHSDYDWVEKYGLASTSSSKFAPYSGHLGTDVVASAGEGTPVLALTDGKVIELQTGLGGVLIEDNESATKGRIRYLHMSGISVGVGDSVTKGSVIGRQSSVGAGGAVHTHVDRAMNNTSNAYDTFMLIVGGVGGPPQPEPKPKVKNKITDAQKMLILLQKKRK